MPKISAVQEQQRREQILQAAMACFARHGYRATSMDDIVRESGLSVGAIYTYFPSKEDLFTAIASERVQQNVEYLTELFAREGPPSEKTDQAVEYFFDTLFDAEQLPYFRMSFEVWAEATRSERLAERHQDHCAQIRDFFLWLLGEAQRQGEVRAEVDVAAATELLLALTDGLMMHQVSCVQPIPPDRLKTAFISFVNHGLSSPEQTFVSPLQQPRPDEETAALDDSRSPSGTH